VPAERTRAVILTTQRTGSTFLVECLDSHPAIHCAGELLNGQPDTQIAPPRGPFRYLVKGARIARTGAWLPHYRLEQYYRGGLSPVRCFKAMYNQLARPFALRYLLDHREIRVIHLRRENLLSTHVSLLLMQKRRELQATQPVAPLQIRVDPDRVIAAMRKAETCYLRFDHRFQGHRILNLTYESLFEGSRLRTETARRICDFLGVARKPMQSRIIKLNPRSLRDIVTNYDELAEALSNTEFASLLTDSALDRARVAGIYSRN
jgi:LPS sulfotransferase NodH